MADGAGPRILIAGHYGFDDIGDEAVLAAMLGDLRAVAPSLVATVVTADPHATSRHGVGCVRWTDVSALAAAVRAADLVLLGGGELFHDEAPSDPEAILAPGPLATPCYAGLPLLAAVFGKPCVIHAVGIGPLSTEAARTATRSAFEQARLASVRDAASQAALASLGLDPDRVRLAVDPVHRLQAAAPARAEEVLAAARLDVAARPRLGVALRSWDDGIQPAAWEEQVARALDEFLLAHEGVAVFVPFATSRAHAANDAAVAHRVRTRMRRAPRTVVLDGAQTPAETAAVLGACDLVLAMRLHAAAFAMSAGVAPLALCGEPALRETLVETGALELVVGLAEAAELGARLSGTYARRALLGERVAVASRRLAERAGEGVRLALATLAGAVSGASPASLEPARQLVLTQTRRLAQTHERAVGLRAQTDSLQSVLRECDARFAVQQAELERERTAAAEQSQKAGAQIGILAAQLDAVHASRGWAFVEQVRRLRLATVPPRSWRARLARLAVHGLRSLLEVGGALLKALAGAAAAVWQAARARLERLRLGNRGRDDRPPPGARASAFDVVCFAGDDSGVGPERERRLIERLTQSGHRVFWVSPRFRQEGPACELRPTAPNLYAVSLRGPDCDVRAETLDQFGRDQLFAALDELRRDHGLGASLCLVEEPFFQPLVPRLREELAWPARELPRAADAGALREAFARVSIVLVAAADPERTRRCLEGLLARTEWPNFELLVVDDGSGGSETARLVATQRSDGRVSHLRAAPACGLTAVNHGLARADGEFVALVDAAVVVTRGWLAALVRHLTGDPTLGVVGPATNAPGAARVETGYADLAALPAWAADYARLHDRQVFDVPEVASACLVLRRALLATAGSFDERFAAGAVADADWCRRVRRNGLRTVAVRDAFVHLEPAVSGGAGGEATETDRRLYRDKWGEEWPADAAAGTQRASTELIDHQLAALLPRLEASRGTIVFLPSIGWRPQLVQRPQHLARAFAAAGYACVFDCGIWDDWLRGFREIEANVYLYKGPHERLGRIRDPTLWAFPYNFHLREHHRPGTRIVYDWIDDLSVFVQERALLERNHRDALAEASLVVSVARTLHEEARRERPDALYLPNGVEYERFALAAPAPAPLDPALRAALAAGRPIAGYYGAIARWFDYALLDELSRLRPDWSFLLIGPDYDRSLAGQAALTRPNVAWLGPRPYEALPRYLQFFDVAMIPFVIDAVTLSTSPLKLYEYFAGARPVVTTPMPECMAFPEVRIAASAAEFARALDEARRDGADAEFRARLQAAGRAHSWSARIEQVVAALGRAGERR